MYAFLAIVVSFGLVLVFLTRRASNGDPAVEAPGASDLDAMASGAAPDAAGAGAGASGLDGEAARPVGGGSG